MSHTVAPFAIGQKVVGLVTNEFVTKGKEYIVADIKNHCGIWAIDVGIALPPYTGTRCSKCDGDWGGVYFGVQFFAPIIEAFQAITYERVLQTELSSCN